jgi:hypothetical protein
VIRYLNSRWAVEDVAIIEDGNSGWTRQINNQIFSECDET